MGIMKKEARERIKGRTRRDFLISTAENIELMRENRGK